MAKKQKNKLDQIREAAEADLLTFIRLVAPHRVLGSIHEEVIQFWQKSDARQHQLVLIPRAHQKSILMAYRVAHAITKNPAVTILYISSTAGLAEKQLKAVKDILTSSIYTRYWPTMVSKDEGKREKWTNSEICVDHKLRKLEGVRDSTVFTGGLTTSLTGFHCDIAVLDDVVVQENAYTEDGRAKVRTQYSLLASIENPDAQEWIVGTRYHPKDLYQDLIDMEEEIYDELEDEIVGTSSVYEVFERQVEDRGDGTGQFLWPRQRRKDGKWFGFSSSVLAKKRAQYLDRMQYRAQYYNDPNDPDNASISSDRFQYYDRKFIVQENGYWYYRNNRLNVYAAIDFAFSLNRKADYTAVVVIGVDSDNFVYILEIDRFKTDRISVYFDHLLHSHSKWNFRKLRAEVSVAQEMIVNELKEKIRGHGLMLSIDKFRPTRNMGTKAERIQAILEPRYDNMQIWHYKGGNCQTLEEELLMAQPPHDDIKDCLASVIEISIAPRYKSKQKESNNILYHSRFGGLAI